MHITPKGQNDRLLIIDDNPDHGSIIQTVLKQHLPKVKPVWVADSGAAITYLNDCVRQHQELPTLILLDLYLPNRDMGLALLRQIKTLNTSYSPTPVVVLSYSNADKDVEEMYQAGCASYLVKPITLDGWQDLVRKLKVYWWDTVIRPQVG